MYLCGGIKINSINDLFAAENSPISVLSSSEFVFLSASIFGNSATDNGEVV